MANSTSLIYLVLSLPTQDFNAYADASIRLRKVMGKKAPNVIILMEHTLRCRDAGGLAEDFLESIGWPVAPHKEPAREARSIRRSISGRATGRLRVLLGAQQAKHSAN
jgi:hypothetical protein